MIRHRDSNTQIKFRPVGMKTAFQNNLTHTLRKNPPMMGAERYKVLSVIALKMRKHLR
ncbi:MAG: hypothetical protein WBP65_23525 [Candidatus Sulfotelmatobacter sp.]|jgi:hypothetical protein